MKKFFLYAAFLCLPISVSAASFQAGDLIEVETDGNAYAAGSVIQVLEEVRGDVYLAGETVLVNAGIREDALLVGEDITINAAIGDDLHALGENILLNADVRGDAMLFGKKIVIGPDVRVGGMAIIAGQKVTVGGLFDEDVRFFATDIVIDGEFLGDVSVNAGNSFSISEDSVIHGDLRLSVPEKIEIMIPEGVVLGEVKKTLQSKRSGRTMADRLLRGFGLFSFLSTLLIGGILIAFARTFAVQYGKDVREDFWKLLGLGFLGIIAPPFIAFLLFLPVITIPLGIVVLIAWGTFLYFGSLLTGLVVANFFFPLQKSETLFQVFGKFALGTFLLSLVRIIPFFGLLTALIFSLLSYGSLIVFQRSAGSALKKAKLL